MANQNLDRLLDITKSKLMTGTDTILGALLCSLNFRWSSDIPTAATNGIDILWNPDWFLTLTPDTRVTVLAHEIWHVARLHMLRRGNRDINLWRQACDIRINNDLENQGKTFEGTVPWLDHSFPKDMAEEDIYEILLEKSKNNKQQPHTTFLHVDEESKELTAPQKRELIEAVSRAVNQTKMFSTTGTSDIEELLDTFLKPVVPWNVHLRKFFTDMGDADYSYQRPNRRYQDVYLPSLVQNQEKLRHLVYYVDVSGSISMEDIIRFNSELKSIWEDLMPNRLTVVQFDTAIVRTQEFKEGDSFKNIKVIVGGGTCLKCVHEHIEKTKPSAAVVFSDLFCNPMKALSQKIPLLWAVIHNPHATVPFGTKINIEI